MTVAAARDPDGNVVGVDGVSDIRDMREVVGHVDHHEVEKHGGDHRALRSSDTAEGFGRELEVAGMDGGGAGTKEVLDVGKGAAAHVEFGYLGEDGGMTDLVEGTLDIEAKDGAVVEVAGRVVDDFVFEQEHGILGSESLAEADEGVGVEFGRF